MGIDVGGNIIAKNGANGVSLNTLVFNAAGQGAANPIPGYTGWKAASSYYGAPAGWEISVANWQSSLNLSNGVFTCPVAGLYAMGYNGIHNGGSNIPTGLNTYGYSGFMKNGVLAHWVHWNGATVASNTSWHTGGTSALFSCQAGDTLALSVNRPPAGNSPDGIAQNYGLYPNAHGAVWCKLVG